MRKGKSVDEDEVVKRPQFVSVVVARSVYRRTPTQTRVSSSQSRPTSGRLLRTVKDSPNKIPSNLNSFPIPLQADDPAVQRISRGHATAHLLVGLPFHVGQSQRPVTHLRRAQQVQQPGQQTTSANVKPCSFWGYIGYSI